MDYGKPIQGNAGAAVNRPATVNESGSQIRDGISLGEQLLSEVHEQINALENRLDTVLTPTPPTPAGATTQPAPMPVVSHVRGRVTILNEGWKHAIDRLAALRARVEV